MGVSSINQAYSFFIFLINGFCIGVIFDIFRILRKSFKTSNFITYVEDILFWILSGILTLFSIIMFNYGEIRLYIFLAILIGVIIYMLTISKFFIRYSVLTINVIKSVLSAIFKVVTYPIKIVFTIFSKILNKPVHFICINIKRISSKIVINTNKSIKKYKKTRKNAVQK